MKKRRTCFIVILTVVYLCNPGQEQEISHSHFQKIVIAGRGNEQQILEVYRNGKDWTEQYMTWEEQTQEAIADYLEIPQN